MRRRASSKGIANEAHVFGTTAATRTRCVSREVPLRIWLAGRFGVGSRLLDARQPGLPLVLDAEIQCGYLTRCRGRWSKMCLSRALDLAAGRSGRSVGLACVAGLTGRGWSACNVRQTDRQTWMAPVPTLSFTQPLPDQPPTCRHFGSRWPIDPQVAFAFQ